MNLLKLMKALAPYAEEDVKVYDLNTEEGLKGYNEQLDILENTGLETLNAFGINGKEWINKMREIGKQVYEANKSKEQNKAKRIVKQAVKQMERKEDDHTEDEPKQEFKRPSELLNVNQKLQLHKIVQEYVDTMIKPFNKNVLTTQQINDAYAGLYEFAAWVMNR